MDTHSDRPLTPPKALPCHLRPVTSWNGRVEISLPAAATPMMVETPHPAEVSLISAAQWSRASELTLVASLESLTHHVDVSSAVAASQSRRQRMERAHGDTLDSQSVVKSSVGHLDELLNDGSALVELRGVDEVGSSHLGGP